MPHLRPVTDAMDRLVAKPAKRRRLVLIAAGGVALLAVAAAAIWLMPSSHAIALKRGETEIAPVQRAPFQDYLPLRAEVAPLTTVYVTAVEGGQVDQVLALDGAAVAAGAPLARLSNPQLRLDVTAREAEIAGRLGDVSGQQLALQRARVEREREIDETRYNLLKARRELDKRQRLRAVGVESDAGVKSFADETEYLEARLKALQGGQARETALGDAQEAQVHALAGRLNANLQVVQDSLKALTVSAPVAGRLTNFVLQPGQALKAGDTVGQIDSEGAYKLSAEIDEFYLGRIAAGQTATVQVGGRTVTTRVTRVLPQVIAGRFHAEFGFDGASGAALRRGQTLDMRLTLGDTRQALVLPNGAWMEGSGGAYAFVLRPSGDRAERRVITIGRRNPQQVELTSGLRAGDKVVVSSYSGLEPYAQLILR
jgi:HlyD family secretion protein